MSIRSDGYNAFNPVAHKFGEDTNPHPLNSNARNEWTSGWLEAYNAWLETP